MNPELLRSKLDIEPSVRIERAAEILQVSLRTMYRRIHQFERVRRRNHWFITVRSLERFIEQQQYGPDSVFDITKSRRQICRG
jgi:hypothetical protein